MEKGVIYCRAACRDQEDTGCSIISQESICRNFADRNGIEITDVFSDNDSADSGQRVGLKKMFNLLKTRDVNFLLISRIDRLTRSTSGYFEFQSALKKNGVKLCSLDIIC